MKNLSFFICFFVLQAALAQINHPKVSPSSKVVQQVGMSTITVDYSRPGVKGRKIFGHLVPYGRIWRVGANASTKITFDSEFIVMGNKIAAGTYALYAFPEKDQWQIAFHSNTAHWGDGRTDYDPKEDVFRVAVTPEKIPFTQENFLITFDELKHDAVQMVWLWEETKVTIPMLINTHQLMLEEIELKLKENPTAQSYYEAARYLQEQEKDYETALEYLVKAIELGGDTYYFYRVKSLVEAKLDDYKSAVTSAKKSLELAESQGKDEFVRMNKKNIELWRSQLKKE